MRRGNVNTVLTVIIAIFCLLGILWVGVKVFGLFADNELKNAQAFIDDISAKIENLEDGESNTFAMRSVDSWVLVGYNKEDTTRPDKCFFDSCICLCKESAAKCQEIGFCRAVDRNISVKSNFSVAASTGAGYNRFDRAFGEVFAACYVMPNTNQLVAMNINKQASLVEVYGPSRYFDKHADYSSFNSIFSQCPGYNREGEFGIVSPPGGGVR